MPSANRMTTAATAVADELEGRYAPLGDYTVGFETFKLAFRWSDHEETYVAGDAYYVEFSPSADLEATTAVVEKNLASAGAQA